MKSIFLKKNPLLEIPCFLEKKKPQKENWKKITKNCQNYLQHERMLKNFLLSYFEYCQIWLSILMDDCHLSNVTKLGEFKKKMII